MMLDRTMLYDMIYALAARDGRDAALFGTCAPLAHEAFTRSLSGDGFPELWFELPFAGDPWFDLHALVTPDQLDPTTPFAPETCGNCPGAFEWFASQGQNARQLALSWDVSAGDIENPAVQLLTGTGDVKVTCAFLAAAGREDAAGAFRAFSSRLPEGWCACYAGMFPRRTTPFLRVECIPERHLQDAYAENAALLEAHLRQAGFTALGDTVVPRTQALARTPFQLEFQFDIAADGSLDDTLGVSVRFGAPSDEDASRRFDPNGEAGALMRQVEGWGLADTRWRLLADATYATRATLGAESAVLYCYPAFLKLRWKNGEPHDAKAYLMAGITY